MTAGAVVDSPLAGHEVTLVELVDRLLGKGVVAAGDVALSVADIDLVYLYREDGETTSGNELSRLYARVAEALTKSLSAVTSEGFCFRVDLNLRPQGRSGARRRVVTTRRGSCPTRRPRRARKARLE